MNPRQKAASLAVQLARGLFPAAATLVLLVLTEWVARGELTGETWAEYIHPHIESYLLSWLFLLLIWIAADTLTRLAPLATLAAGAAARGNAPHAVMQKQRKGQGACCCI